MNLKKKNQRVVAKLYQMIRIRFYAITSTFSGSLKGNPIIMQPVQYHGKGKIEFGEDVLLGYFPAPHYYEGVSYLQVLKPEAKITFGNNIGINNNLTIICTSTSVSVGNDVFIGHDVEILDSDMHAIDPLLRKENSPYMSLPISIGDNVFIGNYVKILKGVQIGKNTIVAHSSLVTKSFPENVVVGGNPAKIISHLNVV